MFDGWYRLPYDQGLLGKNITLDKAVCVSRDETYYIDEDEIIKSNLYVAKFKYKVTAWMPVKYSVDSLPIFYYCREGDQYKNQGKYAEIYADYNSKLTDIKLRCV